MGEAGSGDRSGATVVDLSGHHFYPGLIASTSSLGLTEIASVRATMDVTEMGEHTARLHAYRAVNPDSELIPVARSNGITRANVVPGGRLVRGHAGLLALDGWTWEERMVGGPTGLHMNWPSVRLRHGGDAPPVAKQIAEREEAVQELADLLDRARAYHRARAAASERGAGHTERNLFEGVHSGFERARRLLESGVVVAISVDSGGGSTPLPATCPSTSAWRAPTGFPTTRRCPASR